ncbi:MAG TPA: hypothetical protein PLY35_09455 [Thermotogota bacterium]|nr:hypothetical protein [Thermotogota bacterium]
MSRFLTARDKAFIKGINSELINDIIETSIIIYKRNIDDNTNDIYAESINVFYDSGVLINCLIESDNQVTNISEIGINAAQSIKFSILYTMLQEKNIYPQKGDIVEWNSKYYEVANDVENQLVAGRTDYNYSILLEAFLTNKTYVNIHE